MAIRPDRVCAFAPAKINLFLHVTGKRADGYHDLQSLVGFAGAGDVIVAERATEISLAIDGEFAEGLASEKNNLVLKAAELLAKKFGIRDALRFTLTKNLPVASGIGGGSADAAAALRCALALLDMPDADVMDIAAQVGSDVAVCVRSATAFMQGRGEDVTLLPALPPVPLVLANPGVAVSTASVFRQLVIRNRDRLDAPTRPFASVAELISYLGATRNDLEAPAVGLEPQIGKVLDALGACGALFTRMSGSGATCFGFFESTEGADAAAARMARENPGWWVRATNFVPAEAAIAQ